MSAMQRRKGAQGERELAAFLRELLPEHADGIRRTAPMQAGDPSAAPDVSCPGLWIECKRGKRPNAMAAHRQAVDAAGEGVPIAMTRADHGVWIATLTVDDLIRLCRAWLI